MTEHWKLFSNDLFNDKGMMKAMQRPPMTACRGGRELQPFSQEREQLRAADMTVRSLCFGEGE